MKSIERKIDHIKILESETTTHSGTSNLRCANCKERHYLQNKKGDTNNLICTNCGSLTPIRTIKHTRGLAAPSIQQETAIVQSNKDHNTERKDRRKPKGVNSDKSNPLEESLISKGFQVMDSQVIEPT